MQKYFYSLLWYLFLPIAFSRILFRGFSDRRHLETLGERIGVFGNRHGPADIWIHAVSVGETRAAAPLIRALASRDPRQRLLLTQTTTTGRQAARTLYTRQQVDLAWLPWDLASFQRRFLHHMRPAVGIFLETEIWPNLLRACREQGVATILVNGRLSERSCLRYARLGSFATHTFAKLDLVLAQTPSDARCFRLLGARRVEIVGNLKFDVEVDSSLTALGRQWRCALGHRPVVLIASSRDGEEQTLLAALSAQLPADALIVIVPRHPERFDEVRALIQRLGLTLARRSKEEQPGPGTRVWLGDSMGEMFAWYALADVAVIGGSWLPLGGQNLIEACAVGCPAIVGPHTFNFAQAAEDAIAVGAAQRASNAEDAARIAAALLYDTGERTRMGRAGLEFAAAHRGATERTLALIEPLLNERLIRNVAHHG
jgi:3-deoxy-D-manno-octulosonic-acid transferase